jgi:hypothetical protein
LIQTRPKCNRFTVRSDVDRLYEDAREAVEAAHGDAPDTYLESMAAQKMEQLWEGN